MLTTLYLLPLWSIPSSYISVHLRIILGCSQLSTYCYSRVFQVHTQYISGSSWDAHNSLPTASPEYSKFILTTVYLLPLQVHTHHCLPTATLEYSKFILSTSQDPRMLTTLYLLPLQVHTHHCLPTATPEYSKFILSTRIILG